MGAEHLHKHNRSSKPIDSTSHLVIMGLLPEYVMMRVLGQQLPIIWQAIERHLELCSVCRSEADLLESLMTEVYLDRLPIVIEPPAPDLSFLGTIRSWPHIAQPTHVPSDGSATHQPSLLHTPQPLAISLSLELLTHSQVRMLARAGDARLRYARTIAPTTIGDPTITIEVLAPDDHPDLGMVRICIERPDRSPFDQEGNQVVLQCGVHCYTGATDQSGTILFYDVPLDDIAHWQLMVTPHNMES